MNVAIFGGAGTIGRGVAAELLRRGERVRVVGRSADKLRRAYGGPVGAAVEDPMVGPVGSNLEIVAADVADPAGCTRASAGADAIVYSLGLPYTARAFAGYAPMMRMAVAAARQAGVGRLLLVTNVYAYGPAHAPRVGETHPRMPPSVKGRHRRDQEDIALDAHGSAGLRTMSLRLPDFYGPYADLSLGNLVFDAAVRGKVANLLGPIDTPHEFAFTPDVAPVIADLLVRDDAFGEAYNFGGAAAITVREFAARVFSAAGAPLRLRVASPMMVRLLGIVSPMMRELAEMSHLQTHPVLLDDSKLHAVLGTLRKTGYDEGIRRTLDHVRQRPSPKAM